MIVFIVSISCEKKANWTVQNADNNFIIVNGMISNEQKAHLVQLSKPVSNLNDTAQAVSGAIVTINDTILLTESPAHSGKYYTAPTIRGEAGKKYTLKIKSNGKTFTATDEMLSCLGFRTLRYGKVKGMTDKYRVEWVAHPYNASNPAMYQIQLSWTGNSAEIYYYSLPTIDVSQIFAPEMEKVLFPAGTQISEKKYSLSPGYAEFIRCLISETQWKGGLFDTAPADVPTNLSEGARGYFSACEVISVNFTVTAL
jgi:hypothetical protein